MRIAVDGRHLVAGRGVARYSRSLLDAMAAGHPAEDWRIFIAGRAPVESPLAPVRHLLPGRVLFAAGALSGRPRLDRLAGGADVVWAPAPAPVALSAGVPFVLSLLDLSWVTRPGDFTLYERVWHRLGRLRALAERATRVIAISEATRAQALRHWGLAPEQVIVVHPGPGIGPPPVPPPALRTPPFFLAVGALEPRKAPDLLARAYARARQRGLRAELVYAGEGRVSVAGPGIRIVRRAEDATLRDLYASALALVHPALLEGFAFPPVEALAHGAPAIVADLPVYRETIGPGALRVAAGDEEALAEALLRMERDGPLRARIVAEGRKAIARFSWERAARETHAVLTEAAGR